MNKYLFIYGYESPLERVTNADSNTDFESSNAIWILASTREKAIECGLRYAEMKTEQMYSKAGINDFEGWAKGQFAYWIEDNPLDKYSGIALDLFDEIIAE